jgi:hypothetical protein
MNGRVIQTLILKYWRLQRTQILISMAGGGLALVLLQVRSETTFLVGSVWFFVALIVLGSMVPVSNVINERKKQSLAFVMSLPISALQYGISKMLSTLGLFLAPWGVLVIAASAFILSRGDIPKGIVPVMFISVWPPSGRLLHDRGDCLSQRIGRVDDSSYHLVQFVVRSGVVLHYPHPRNQWRFEKPCAGVEFAGVDDSGRGGSGGRDHPGADLLPAIQKAGVRLGIPCHKPR